PALQAMGGRLERRGIAQVAMNLLDYRVTSLPQAFDAVRSEAARRGVGGLRGAEPGERRARGLERRRLPGELPLEEGADGAEGGDHERLRIDAHDQHAEHAEEDTEREQRGNRHR